MNTKMNRLAPEVKQPLLNLRTGRHHNPAGDPYSNPGPDRDIHLDSNHIPDLEAVKARQKATWESGDFGRIARTIENVAEEFMARPPLYAGTKVLDVACGTGNLAVIAARS
jgi:2-polyprenyl-3-methyl-5-hydroxy-6-metoxy-1,4-benzoquinol methylase